MSEKSFFEQWKEAIDLIQLKGKQSRVEYLSELFKGIETKELVDELRKRDGVFVSSAIITERRWVNPDNFFEQIKAHVSWFSPRDKVTAIILRAMD